MQFPTFFHFRVVELSGIVSFRVSDASFCVVHLLKHGGIEAGHCSKIEDIAHL